MEWLDIKNNLLNISDFSVKVYNACRDNNALFDYIDALPSELKNELYSKYFNSEGPVLGIRKQIVEEFLIGPVNRVDIIERFENGKRDNPKRYTQYKNLFSILYPFFSCVMNELVYDTLDKLAEKIQTDIQLADKTDIKSIGFEGGRNTGSEHVWIAIYNNSHPNQKNAKQLYFSILNSVVTYALYDRGKDLFIEKETTAVESLDYNTLIGFYTKHKNAILSDNYRANLLLKYPLEKLIASLNAGVIKSWLIKPGEKGSMWKKAISEEKIRIGWGYVVIDIYDENNFEDSFILEKLDEHYPNPKEGTRQTNNKTSIKSFLLDVAIGDIVFAVSGKWDIIGMGVVSSETELDEEDEEYSAFHNVDWLIDLSRNPYHPNYSMPIKTVTALEAKLSVTILNSIFNYTPKLNNIMELPFLNTILYGPPGTGKTYELNCYKKQLFTDSNKEATTEELLIKKVKEHSLWEIVAAVLLVKDGFTSVSEICDSVLVKLKKDPKKPTRSYYLVRNSLIAYSDDSSSEYKKKRKDRFFTKNENAEWSVIPELKEELKTIIGNDIVKLANGENIDLAPNELKELSSRYNFITFHQKYSYEDFIEGIKPVLRDDDDIEEQVADLQFELKRGIFYNSCLQALKIVGYSSFEDSFADSFESRKAKYEAIKMTPDKQFALFIDEINRANISAVFGELITLLEDDKRMGADNEMWVELPYSNEKFCVPSNLYVIGTMNTADRSIALLDIALRRRFEFKPLYPLYTETEWWSSILEALNQAIYNSKKNPDFFIGHAFFINRPESDKIKILNTKIIPLLYEYCQNNAETVKRILSEAGIQIKITTIKENFQIIAE